MLHEKKPVFSSIYAVTIDQKDIPGIVDLAVKAHAIGYIVLAYSSGGGWMNDQSTPELSAVQNSLHMLDSACTHLQSRIFNNRKAEKLIETFKVDEKELTIRHNIEVANNPYLLHCFSNTHG